MVSIHFFGRKVIKNLFWCEKHENKLEKARNTKPWYIKMWRTSFSEIHYSIVLWGDNTSKYASCQGQNTPNSLTQKTRKMERGDKTFLEQFHSTSLEMHFGETFCCILGRTTLVRNAHPGILQFLVGFLHISKDFTQIWAKGEIL